ncbi:hypothetical protein SAMN05421505_14437 [Sinosporangium album]|uniref:Uncharacterized protein n=1 Tax=Sinosporangium album TaxID=504805 RepID=A0A1G8JP69_9ACTN|nr:hypothetical protein [Sinosporangium album]SDI33054.1 hypothetical protein SAMN05421505_14437 [Sinosporangium album]
MVFFVVVFGLTWWLGLYVVLRGWGVPGALRAGLGIVVFALALAVDALRVGLPGDVVWLGRVESVLIGVPLLLWSGACVRLVGAGDRLDWLWRFGVLPVGVVGLAGVVLSGGLFEGWHPAHLGLAVVLVAPLLGLAVLLARVSAGWLVVLATLFAGLGGALFLLPMRVPGWMLLGSLAVDMAMLGVAVSRSSAFLAGEVLWRDMFRSLLGAVAAGVLFGSQVLLLGVGEPSALPVVFGVVATAVTVFTLADPVHRLLDRLAFAGDGVMRRELAELRDSAAALPRLAEAVPVDDEEFVRLTRRALAAYGDLAKLTSSPLVHMPVVERRVRERGAGQPLDRAAELKQLLLESITRLKPRDGEFGTSEEWRYFNVLYFPYVVGLRPYRRGATHHGLSGDERRAFEWFVTQVPERTLYNWQKTAAKLIADDLRRGNRQ